MPRIKHVHDWRLTFHMDSCHTYQSAYHCSTCGADLGLYGERNLVADPYSVVWMEPSGHWVNRDEKGRFCKPYYKEDVCERCQELQAGAEPKRLVMVTPQKARVT
jgi:hypothetical protein